VDFADIPWQKPNYHPYYELLRIHAKSLKCRYVDDLPEFKAQRIIFFLVVAQPSN
jgi:hypothetical protein